MVGMHNTLWWECITRYGENAQHAILLERGNLKNGKKDRMQHYPLSVKYFLLIYLFRRILLYEMLSMVVNCRYL